MGAHIPATKPQPPNTSTQFNTIRVRDGFESTLKVGVRYFLLAAALNH